MQGWRSRVSRLVVEAESVWAFRLWRGCVSIVESRWVR